MKKLKTFILLFCLIIPCFFVACSNENKDVMRTPTELTVETGGKITFERVKNEEYYVIEVDNLLINVFPKTNSNVDLFSIDGTDYLEYDASKIFTLGESYSIKVKACANEKKDSAYTRAVSYKHTLPIEKPENAQINNLTLTWDSVENASYYKVKVVTPTDKTVADDSETIASLDLTAYQFSVNKFDFASILTHVGEYKFYINAVSFDKNYTESGYTSKVVYTHKLTLDTPSSLSVHKVNEMDATSGEYVDNLHLVAVLDSNTNAVTLTTNTTSKIIDLSAPNNAVTLDNNIIDINLNQLLDEDFDELTQYKFTLQSNYLVASESTKYYNDSKVSDIAYYDNYAQISKPVVSVEYDALNNTNVAHWGLTVEAELNNVAGYVLYLHKASGVITETVGTDVSSRILTDDILAISVEALGKGNYISSPLSDTVSLADENIASEIEFSVEIGVITWTDVADHYLIELDGLIMSLDEPTLDLTTLNLTLGAKELKVIVVLDGYIPYVAKYEFNYSIRLSAPSGCGFVNTNPYLLTFASVNNAIGYYVYLNGEKIDKLFTTTAIDLSQYVIKDGEYKNYTVTVQAVANTYSGYKNSAFSTELIISHTKVLAKPQFKQDSDGDNAPIEKKLVNGKTAYYLYFYGVDYALIYEVMINFNKITVLDDNRTGLYEVDVTDYLSSANSYTITVRAIPSDEANIKASEKNSFDYVLRLQLDQVTGIKTAWNDGIYTLSFDLQDNAKEYSIHIVKVNDNGYDDYLHGLGLKNLFTVAGATDITKYVREAGLYEIYVTAIADASGGYYADSDESSEYAEINKLTTLSIPTEIQFNDKSENEYLIRWTGDEHADYYVIRVTDANGDVIEYKTANNATTYNINESFTTQGQYHIKIKSMITPNSENAVEYQSSSYCESVGEYYIYNYDYDFKRYSVFMYGNNYDFYIENVSDLMYVLWHHLLYGVDSDNGLRLYLELDTGENTINEALIRLADEATTLGLHSFDTDTNWDTAQSGGQGEMFKYLSQVLLELYPEYAILEDLTCAHDSNSNIFTLRYANALDVEKAISSASFTYIATDYGNKYNYLADSARRKASTSFAIDTLDYIDVTTTEQLLMAVQYGKRPNFVGDSEIAETVYENAKSVLLTIVNNTMSDYEKAVAIFDWLEYAIDLNYYADRVTTASGLVQGTLSDYGTRSDYYLEGVFLNLTNTSVGGYDNEFYLGNIKGTSESYAKAFTLLCAIEGINVRKVNGTFTYTYGNTEYEIDHTWNKVYLELTEDDDGNKIGAWYALDLMLSDNKYVYYEKIKNDGISALTTGYGMSSHTYFLVTDNYLSKYLGLVEDDILAQTVADTTFDYYSNANFSMTLDELKATLAKNQYTNVDYVVEDFSYSKKYIATEYQLYPNIAGYSSLQAYIANAILYANNQLNNVSDDNLATFEIKFSKENDLTGTISELAEDIKTLMTNTNTSLIPVGKRTKPIDIIYIEDGEGNVTYICTMGLV